jgi:hypothetical protein
MKIRNRLLVTPGKKTKLSDIDPDETLGLKNDERSHKMLQKLIARLDDSHTENPNQLNLTR